MHHGEKTRQRMSHPGWNSRRRTRPIFYADCWRDRDGTGRDTRYLGRTTRGRGAGLNFETYLDYEQFLSHDMDAVVLANYFHQHAPLAIQALAADKKYRKSKALIQVIPAPRQSP